MRRLWNATTLIVSLLLVVLAALPGLADSLLRSDDPAMPAERFWHGLPHGDWRILLDASASLTLKGAIRQRDRFVPLDHHSLALPADQAAWLHVPVTSPDDPRWIWVFAPRVDRVDFFLTNHGVPEREIGPAVQVLAGVLGVR